METFTIITGSGRCGTSALTKFFINSSRFLIQCSTESPTMRAGYENVFSTSANINISKNNIRSAKNTIKRVTQTNDIVKTPTFFFYNTFKFWKENNTKNHLQVFLLKRDNLENVFTSASKTSRPRDWDYFQDALHLQNHYLKNINTLNSNNIKYIELEFPKFTLNSEYLYTKLLESNFSFTKQEVIDLSKQTFDPSKITIK